MSSHLLLASLLESNLAEVFQSPFIVPCFGTVMILGIVVAGIWSGVRTREMQSQERLAAIAKGLPPEPVWNQAHVQSATPNVVSGNVLAHLDNGYKSRRAGILLIAIGTLLEGLPALIILAPLLLPIATGLGIHPVQYGIVLILAMGVGTFMPPVGIGFYVASAVAGSKVEAAAKTMVPYIVVLVLAVVLIAFVPDIALIVPRLIGGKN